HRRRDGDGGLIVTAPGRAGVPFRIRRASFTSLDREHHVMFTATRDFVTILVRRRVIRQEQLAEAREFQCRTGSPLAVALVRLGYATAQEVLVACAEALGLAFLDLTAVVVPVEVIELVPESVARELCILPVAVKGGTITVALGNLTDLDAVQKLEFILNKE